MNNKYQDLAREAGLLVHNPDLMPTKLQKFAELLVRECANQVDWILAEGGKTQGDLIREHFGVEL
jgi:hypothetical protein